MSSSPSSMARDSFNSQSLGALNSQVKEAKLLMVGAGGIGCELLKNLVLTGFGEIHIVDLDTIDLSNLNRQFLFRYEHIKKSKALVAKEAAHKFNPQVKLEAHHGNIKDAQFNLEWFKGFTMVFNALDNLEARRHVNKMCLAADVPLIESGTTGFNGQVQVIKKGVTACYDCTVKETPKTYPVCTIRSTPSQPIHCIVWGKSYLLSEVFGASEEAAPEVDNTEDSENAKEIEKLRQEAQALAKIKEAMGTEEFPQLLFDKIYKDDIERLRSMEEMWKTRQRPNPIDYATIVKESNDAEARKLKILKEDQRAWTLYENVVVFKDSLKRLSQRMEILKSTSGADSAEAIITFDKDDDDTLDFVAASANLRSIIFGIETKSRFDIKQMAGNIIPAIATTNAIVAGLCVLQSFKVLRGEYQSTKEIFLSPFAPERLMSSDRYRRPNPECAVCSPVQTRVAVDLSRATLRDLVEDVLRSQLGYGDEFAVNSDIGTLYDAEEEENLIKKLTELGIKGDSFLTVIDDDDVHPRGPRVNLILNVQESAPTMDKKPIEVLDITATQMADTLNSPIPRRKKPPTPPEDSSNRSNGNRANGTGAGVGSSNGTKRTGGELESPLAKRPKTAVNGTNGSKASNDIVVVDDSAGGAIVIDDD